MSFNKKIIRTVVMMGALLIGFLFVTPDTSYAQDIYCGTHNGYEYYVDSDAKYGTRSKLKYIGVKRSDGNYYTYCFENRNGPWNYNYSKGHGNGKSVFDKFQPVSSSRLANDILYTLLQIW